MIHEIMSLRACLDFFLSSLNTLHSIFVTYNPSFKISKFFNYTRLAHITQLFITHTFLIFVGPIPVTWSVLLLSLSTEPFPTIFSFLIFPSPLLLSLSLSLSLHPTLSTTKLTSSAFFSTRGRSSQTHKQIMPWTLVTDEVCTGGSD